MDENENDYGWPGDGSGMDDLADYNAQEARDYDHEGGDDRDMGDEDPDPACEESDRGGEDSFLDSYYEGLTDLGE